MHIKYAHTHTHTHAVCSSQTYISNGIQSRVCANTEVRARYIVGDCGRHHDHRDTELIVFLPGSGQLHQSQIGLQWQSPVFRGRGIGDIKTWTGWAEPGWGSQAYHDGWWDTDRKYCTTQFFHRQTDRLGGWWTQHWERACRVQWVVDKVWVKYI